MLWQLSSSCTLKGKRDRAILAILLGCGLRRGELIELTWDHLQRREDQFAIPDVSCIQPIVDRGEGIRQKTGSL